MARVAIAAIVGAVILFLWGFLYWVGLAVPQKVIHPVPSQDQVAEALRVNVRQKGAYWYPADPHHADGSPTTPQELTDFTERHQRGPVFLLFYQPQGFAPMAPQVFIQGLTVNFVYCLLAAMLLHAAGLKYYLARVAFLTGISLAMVVGSFVKQAVWLYLPLDYTLVITADAVGGAFLAAVVMAFIVRPGEDPVLAK
jgi:hypothetical protein